MGDILQEERQDTLLEEQDIQQEDMVTPQVDIIQEEQQGTLLEEVTLPEVMDTPLEAMDTQQGTLQEVLTLLGATDRPLEVMDTLQAAILDILLEGIQDLLEVDTTADTTER